MNKITIVAKREYLRNIKKVTFWLATLFFPLFMLILSFISGYSTVAVTQKLEEETKNSKTIYILDETGFINQELIQKPYVLSKSFEDDLTKVKRNEAEALFVYPANVKENGSIRIYEQSKGIMFKDRYNQAAIGLLKNSILSNLKNPDQLKVFNTNLPIYTTTYKEGNQIIESIEKIIPAGIAVFIYFMLVNFANSYLLSSVAEEKENRMIEIVLTTLTPRQLITGKILGQLATVLTQIFTLIAFVILGFTLLQVKLPIDVSQIDVDGFTILRSIIYTIIGFLILGNIMVGVGAAMPNYRDAQNFSAVFIIVSMLPIYFFTIILAEPSGLIAKIVSYFPLTAPMILMFRSALGELSFVESLIGWIVILVYTVITYFGAIKLFEFGSLQYSQRISLKDFITYLRK